MRNVLFEVPYEVIGDFCPKLLESGLDNSIVDCTDDEISIEVEYEKSDEKAVDKLEAFLDDLIADLEEEDNEGQEDED
jgi:hypothetical protein